jgi:hypothetical protein
VRIAIASLNPDPADDYRGLPGGEETALAATTNLANSTRAADVGGLELWSASRFCVGAAANRANDRQCFAGTDESPRTVLLAPSVRRTGGLSRNRKPGLLGGVEPSRNSNAPASADWNRRLCGSERPAPAIRKLSPKVSIDPVPPGLEFFHKGREPQSPASLARIFQLRRASIIVADYSTDRGYLRLEPPTILESDR